MIAFIPMARPTGRYFGSKSKRRTKDQKEITMQIGMIGLRRMGADMARRLIRKGHTCVVYERFSSRGEADFANKLCPRCGTNSVDIWRSPTANPKSLEGT